MMRSLLLRGMLLGVLAGLLAFLTAHTLGEPQVDKAISFEDHIGEHHHDAAEPEEVTRDVQSTWGLGAGTLVSGIALGGIFALVFAVAYGRLGTMTVRGTAAVLGAMGYVAMYVVPNLKYPANPPSVGDPDTIGRRTAYYALLILASVLLMVVAVVVRRRYAARVGEWNATLLAGAVYVVGAVVCFLAFPGVNEVPQQALHGVVPAVTDAGTTFPPVVLWRFRVASFTIQAVLWATLGLGFGVLAQRLFDRERPGADAELERAGR